MFAYEAQVHSILDDAHPSWLTPRQLVDTIDARLRLRGSLSESRSEVPKVYNALYRLVKKRAIERRVISCWSHAARPRYRYRAFLTQGSPLIPQRVSSKRGGSVRGYVIG